MKKEEIVIKNALRMTKRPMISFLSMPLKIVIV